MVLKALNITVLAPMPKPSVTMANRLNPGLRDSERTAKRSVRHRSASPRRAPGVADLLAVRADVAELAPRRQPGLALGHALAAVLLDELVEVKLQLGVERRLLLAPAEEPARPRAQPPPAFAHHDSSIARTLAIAAAKDSQCAFSSSSCFLPARVNR
jgi:hypothetical protein